MREHHNRELWYRSPAHYWEEALPIGNGRLGAMLYGGIAEDIIRMNEDTFWSGYPKKVELPGAPEHYRKARVLALEGKYEAAEREIEDHLLGEFTDSYLPLGELKLEFPQLSEETMTDYERYLSLEDAVSGSGFTCGGVAYRKEAFISWPEQALYLRIQAGKQGALSFRVGASSQMRSQQAVREGRLVLTGIAPSYDAPSYLEEEDPVRYSEREDEKGMRFCMMTSVETDGQIREEGGKLLVQNAGFAVLRVCAATSFNGFDRQPFLQGKDEHSCCLRYIKQAETLEYEEARERHKKDFQQYFNRMDLQLSSGGEGEEENCQIPTDERIRTFFGRPEDVGLYELFFHYGRYLLISSSRPGTQPANLQGIWNVQVRPPWSSNYTLNINAQMNYWPAEPCGLPELHEPLFCMIEELCRTGRRTAEAVYGAGGFTAHHNSDIWRLSTPVGRKGRGTAVYAYWPMGAGWLCRHLFEHYEYTLDEDFLRDRAYPLLLEAARFYCDVLVENQEGKLIFAPATSPENHYSKEGFRGAVAASTAMTQEIIREVFEECIVSADILGCRDTFIEELNQKKEQLLVVSVGEDGRLLEWNEPLQEEEVTHRHLSHLYGLYPGMLFQKEETPELAEACRKSLLVRGDPGTGWSLSWKVCAWARLWDGDHALAILRQQMKAVRPEGFCENSDELNYSDGGGVYPNLFDAHPPFQIDGNFGSIAGITEMFLQSTREQIRLLPALPRRFAKGCVRGVRARGRVTVDLYFVEGGLEKAVFHTDRTQERIVACGAHKEKVKLEAGIPFVYYGEKGERQP